MKPNVAKKFKLTYMVFLKDDLWSLNFVLLCSISQYGLSLLHLPLREQPPRRLWDEPASVINTEIDRLQCGNIRSGLKKETINNMTTNSISKDISKNNLFVNDQILKLIMITKYMIFL